VKKGGASFKSATRPSVLVAVTGIEPVYVRCRTPNLSYGLSSANGGTAILFLKDPNFQRSKAVAGKNKIDYIPGCLISLP